MKTSSRTSRRTCARALLRVLALFLSVGPAAILAAPFTPGNVVIYRVGDGSSPLAATGNPVFLDEYSPAGTVVQSITMPTTVDGGNRRLVSAGNATSEGGLTRSTDGRYLVLAGYDAAIPHASALNLTASATVNRTVGRVAADGTVDTTTALADFADAGSPRGVASVEGSFLWTVGATGGVRLATTGATSSTQLADSPLNLREARIFDGKLHVSGASGSVVRIGVVGASLPFTSGQTISNLPGFPVTGSPYAFHMADFSSAVPGPDTLYVADDSGGLQKYSLVSGSWISTGVIGTSLDNYRGIVARVSGGVTTLYVTRKAPAGATGGGELVKLVDSGGYNAPFIGDPVVLATAASYTAFRGVALAPHPAPEFVNDPLGVTIAHGATATLTVAVNGSPAPSLQWYRGTSGDTSHPVSGANSVNFTTPVLTTTTSYWVRATNASGSADSDTAVVIVQPPAIVVVESPPGTPLEDGVSFDFGSHPVGSAGTTRTFVMRNTSSHTLWVHIWGSEEFKLGTSASSYSSRATSSAGELLFLSLNEFAPGESAEFTITFAPSGEGERAGSVQVVGLNTATSEVLGSFFSVFSGTGTPAPPAAPVIAIQPASRSMSGDGFVSLNVVAAGSPAPTYQWYVGESGDTSNPYYPGEDFSKSVIVDVAPVETTRYWVRVTNSEGSVDSDTAVVTVGNGAPIAVIEQPAGVVVANSPLPAIFDEENPLAELDPASIRSFGNVPVGQSVTMTFVLRNSGTSPLVMGGWGEIGATTDFEKGGYLSSTLDPGESTTFDVVFTPTEEGMRSVAFHLSSNNNQDDYVFGVAGFGTPVLATGVNLLANGDAEAGEGSATGADVLPVPGWTSGGNATVVQYGAPEYPDASTPGPGERGLHFFSGGPENELSTLTQEIEVGAFAAGFPEGLDLKLSGHLGGWTDQQDYCAVTAECLDDSGDTLGVISIGPVSEVDRGNLTALLYRESRAALPFGTHLIRVTWVSIRIIGEFNDGYADNLSLVLLPAGTSAPNITTQPASQSIASGATATLTTAATGDPAPAFQWYLGASGDTSNPVSGETSSSFTTPPLTSTTSYWVQATNASGSAASTTAVIQILSPGLVHRWSFTDASDSVGGASLTLVGNASLSGGKLELPGSTTARTHHASVPIGNTIAGLTDMTVEGWFTLDTLTNWSKLWSFGNPNGGVQPGLSNLTFTPRASTIPRLEFDSPAAGEFNTGAAPNPTDLVAGTSYHVVGVYDTTAGQMRLYLNGLLMDSAAISGPVSQMGVTAQNFLGAAVSWPDPDLDGRIDELRIWGRPLDAAEVAWNHAKGPDDVQLLPPAPVIVSQPANEIIASGSSATLDIIASGTPPPSYQWYLGESGDTSTPISGATSATYTTPPLTSSASYWVRATNGAGSVDSATMTVSANASPASDFTTATGHSALTITGYTGPGGHVVIPSQIGGLPVRAIGAMAFNTWNVTGVILPETLVSIAQNAFWNCTALTTVTIPANVTSIAPGPFVICTALTGIEVADGNPAYRSVDGVLFDIGGTQLIQYPGGRPGSYAVPDGVITLGSWAFHTSPWLTGVTMPDSLRVIGRSAFENCTGLVGVTIPDSVVSVGFLAFWGCKDLTRVTVGGGVASLGDRAFDACTSLTSMIFEGNAPAVGTRVFSGTLPGLTVYFHPGASGFTTPAWQGCPAASIVPAPRIVTQPRDRSIASGATAILSVAATGDPAPAYQWYQGESGDTSQPIDGETSDAYMTPPLTTQASYWVRATNGQGSADSTTATVRAGWGTRTVGFNFYHGNSVAYQTISSAENTATLDEAAGLNTRAWYNLPIAGAGSISNGRGAGTFGGISVLTYAANEWAAGSEMVGVDNDASQTVFRSYLDDGDGGGSYFNGDGIGASIHVAGIGSLLEGSGASSYRLTVFYNTDSTGNLFPAPQVRQGMPSAASASAITSLPLLGHASVVLLGPGVQPNPAAGSSTGGSAGRRAWGELGGLTQDAITIAMPIRSGDIRATIAGFALSVETPPSPPVVIGQPASTVVAAGTVATLDAVFEGSPAPAYQWYRGPSGDTSAPVAGATLSTFTTPPVTGTTTFWVRATNVHGSANSAAATVTASTRVEAVYRYYRFVTVGTRNPAANAVQLAEVTLYRNGIRQNIRTAMNPGGSSPVGEDFRSAVDRNVGTKWLDWNKLPLVIDAFPSGVLQVIDSYSITTANDYPARDPIIWRLEGSSGPNGPWSVLDERSQAFMAGRFTEYGPLAIHPAVDASLAGIGLDAGSLSPFFDPAVTSYAASVSHGVAEISLLPEKADANAALRLNGAVVASGNAVVQPLAVGANVITILVTAGDGITTRTYTVTVNRAAPLAVTTEAASVESSSTARLKGSVTPHGAATVFFEYGKTTGYGGTTAGQAVSGSGAVPAEAVASGLEPNTTYHFRAVAVNAEGTNYGADRTFTTAPAPPVAATGDPTAVGPSGATLVGAVDPRGLATSVYFEYGLTTLYGKSTPVQTVSSSSGIVDVLTPNGGLIPGATYHYRIVASNFAGTSYGEDVTFVATAGSGTSNPLPTALPVAVTGGVAGATSTSVVFLGNANPSGGTTVVHFEYGATPGYGSRTAIQGIGNVTTDVSLALAAAGLQPGTTYHYRAVASNSQGTTQGADATFTTPAAPPQVVTGAAEVLDTTRVRVTGSVRAGNGAAQVFVDYGTDPVTFGETVAAGPASVSGDGFTPVTAVLENLGQGLRYYYRVRAAGEGTSGVGETRHFDVALISGLIRQAPGVISPSARQGSLSVTISPPVPGSGWRLAGEVLWRESGEMATGLVSGDRTIEYRPVAGHLQPPAETVAVASIAETLSLTRSYQASGATGSGSVTVLLKPEGITAETRPFEQLAKWALYGETDSGTGQPLWRSSGETLGGLLPGDHLILAKSVEGRTTPRPVTVTIRDGQDTLSTITYYVAEELVGVPPVKVAFEEIGSHPDRPYAHVGQIRTDAGSGTGFVVRPGVVATAGHVVFDDGTLSTATGVQWLFQHSRDVHEPVPQVPRGHYLLTGYAAQRGEDGTPGESTPESQNLDAAAMYFPVDPGRGGFSGYLASDATANEFLLSPALKTLVGYPVDGIAEEDQDKLHATPAADVAFVQGLGKTYVTSDIRASGGASGGPLCVMDQGGNYYPAAVYLGGTRQTVVRAFDSEVARLIGFAESSAGASAGETGGDLAEEESSGSDPEAGELEVIIEPSLAREGGAGWRIQAGSSWLASGGRLESLSPNDYALQFAEVPGFLTPASPSVTVEAGTLKRLTFTYEKLVLAPAISMPASVVGTRGASFAFLAFAANDPASWSLTGLLPAGLTFSGENGRLSGTPGEAGVFDVLLGAQNSGGADTSPLRLTILPVLANQSLTAPLDLPVNHAITSSESATADATYSAEPLPPGLVFQSATGVISGVPQEAGSYPVTIRVTRRGATSSATLTIHVTGAAPAITSTSPVTPTVAHGGTATLQVNATGQPAPSYQWYEGTSGDTSRPIPGASGATHVTPSLTAADSYWVRVSSISGSVDSATFTVSVLPSDNAHLASLTPGAGLLSPPFNPGIFSYSLRTGHAVDELSLLPVAEVIGAEIRVDEAAPGPDGRVTVPLAVGMNTIAVEVVAPDAVTVLAYTLQVERAGPSSATTGTAADASDTTSLLAGSVTANGEASVFFQYGTTASYGTTTPGRDVSGFEPVAIQELLTGLVPDTVYHYRIGITSAAGTWYGSDTTFATKPAPPLAATGTPANVGGSEATLVGAVHPNGRPTEYYFEYGSDTSYGSTTDSSTVPAGDSVVDVIFLKDGLTPGETYHYRTVAENDSGITYGEDVSFTAGADTGATTSPVQLPTIASISHADVTGETATLLATVNPNAGTTFVRFDYGPTAAYGSTTESKAIGNGTDNAIVVIPLQGLLPGTAWHFRAVASNSQGTVPGGDATFTTVPPPPSATTGEAVSLTTTSVRISGSVRARGVATEVFVEYGTDGVNFPSRVRMTPGTVLGAAAVQVDLTNLVRGTTYRYRVVADATSGGSGHGEVRSFRADALAGLVQKFSALVTATDRAGSVKVNLQPPGVGAWRFDGERSWRAAGSAATGLTNGDRIIEFLPVPGYIQPPNELVGVVNGEVAPVLERIYYLAGAPRSGSLRVFLEPSSISAPEVPEASRARWRLSGESAWRDSGSIATGLAPGDYLVEYKAVPGRGTPTPGRLTVPGDGVPGEATTVYPLATPPPLSPPRVVPFAESSSARDLPFAHVGQFLTDSSAHSGFVVKARVVATVAEAVFDEETLSVRTGMQWRHQRDAGTYEPAPLSPRGFYSFDGYAAQRQADGTPGTQSAESQNRNVAALYFSGEAGRGGYAGFLSSDEEDSPYLNSSFSKLMAGYPVNGVSAANQGRMHATTPSTGAFTRVHGRTWNSGALGGLGGMAGGPLAVRHAGGAYYPAAIYLGGASSGLVRAIDGEVVDLFNRAETSAAGGDNNTSGGITHTSVVPRGSGAKGGIKVIIQPAQAVAAGAGWRLVPESSWRPGGATRLDISPGPLVLEMREIPGFAKPVRESVAITASNTLEVTYTYGTELSELAQWRKTMLGTAQNTGAAADGADADGDGQSNLDEYTAGTDPMNAADHFKVGSMVRAGGSFSLTVSGKAGRVYRLQRSGSLGTGEWSATPVDSSSPAVDGPVQLTDGSPPPGRAFYRVVVTKEDP